MSALELCENCGRQIGRLEQAHSWDDHVVCAACKHVLSLQSQMAAPAQRVTPPPLPPLRRTWAATTVNTTNEAPLPEAVPQPAPAAPAAKPEPPAAVAVPPVADDVDACEACGAVFPKEQLVRDENAGGNPRRVCPACSLAAAAARKVVPAEPPPPRAARAEHGPSRVAIAVVLVLMCAAAWGATFLLGPTFPDPRQQAAADANAGRSAAPATVTPPAKPVPPTIQPPVPTAPPTAGPAPAPAPTKAAVPPPPAPSNTIFSDDSPPAAPQPAPERKRDPIDMTPTPPRSVAARSGTSGLGTATSRPHLVVTPPAKPGKPAPPDSNTQPPVNRSSTTAQLALGNEALKAHDFKRAVQAFKDAMDGQRNSTQAMHGLGLAYAYMGEKAKGVATLEKAMAQGADRAIAHNLAVMHLHDRNPVRAAKFLRDYLSRPGVPLDEPLQNLLGAALAAAGDDARSGPVYAEVRDFYFVYDGRLNAARADGKKRWGMQWIPAGRADYNWKVSKSRAEEFERLRIAAGRATVRKQRARDAVHDFNTSMALHTDDEQRTVWRRMEGAVKDERAAHKGLEGARNLLEQTEMPPFPKDFQFIPIDALSPDKHPPQL